MKQTRSQSTSRTSERVVKSIKVQRAAEEVLRKYENKYSQPQVIKPGKLSWIKTPTSTKKSA